MNSSIADRVKLSQLRALVAAAERGNFSEAALHLGISQSAVSHAIASLEAELGVILLLRGRHGAALTPVGERILPQARQVLQLLTTMTQEANRAKGLQGGKVRVASFRSVATHVLPEVIVRFRQKFPSIEVMLTEYDDHPGVDQALREGRTDIGFTYLPSSEDFEVWEILRDEYIILLPPTASFLGSQLTWEQLQTYPLIMHSEGVSCYERIRNHLLAAGQPLNVAYTVREDSTIIGMVAQGLGATILPSLSTKPLPPEIKTYSLPIPLERIVGVAVLANALHPPSVFAFLDSLKQSVFVTPP